MTETDFNLSDRQAKILDLLPASTPELAEYFDITPSTMRYHLRPLKNHDIIRKVDDEYVASVDNASDPDPEPFADVDPEDADPDPSDLSDRQRVIADELKTGATPEALADALGEREPIIDAHLRDMKQRGWAIYRDDTTGEFVLEGDHALRSSEHKGTRTRKANRWWEKRHNHLVREYKHLSEPSAPLPADHSEDWVLHVTDTHAGDRGRMDDGTVVYNINTVERIIDYITERSITLADVHGVEYDTAHICLGGDLLTGEGVYEGMHEDLDAWLDEQHNRCMDAILRLIKHHASAFPAVNIVCQVGNHGKNRASGTSRQANADLILYKSLRNVLAQLQEHGVATNVNMQIGEASPYKNFALRNGLVGHLRHGDNRKPQATTAAGSRDWARTLNDHEFDLALMGHHHISGRIAWDGPPIIVSGSPKPPGEFVDKVYGRVNPDPREYHRDIATCAGVASHGITSVYPVKTHEFQYVSD